VRKALFLDRDGVINYDFGYVHRREDLVFVDGIFEVLKRAQQMGYKLFIVTNQSGIGRGYFTKVEFLKLMNYIVEEFEKRGIEITDFAYCLHHPDDNCSCRKPEPGLIEELAYRYQLDLKNSIMVGDKPSDVEAGKRAGVALSIQIETPYQILEALKRI
jgi:D-glycero-D-manno-heptose 1,7-bisphosphate phosphatase